MKSADKADSKTKILRCLKGTLIAAFLIVLPLVFHENRYLITVFISCLLFGIWGALYDLQIGYAGLINFGFAGFICAGAYGSGLCALHYNISPWLGLLIGGVIAGIIGLITGLITLRLRGIFLGLATWFIAEMLVLTISNTPDYTRGMLGLTVIPFPDLFGLSFARTNLLSYYYLLLFLGIIIIGTSTLMVRSKIGLSFKAIREDQVATESLGLNPTKYKLINFITACFFTGVTGAFYAHYIGILTPEHHEFGVPRTVEVLTMAYVGGRGSLWGAIAASFLLIGFQEYFRELAAWRLVFFGLLLICIMLFAPKGLAGLKKHLW